MKSTLARSFFVLVAVLAIAVWCVAADPKVPLLFQTPTLSATQIAFVYGGDIWIVGRSGGEVRRLVRRARPGKRPYLSPDGSMVAFSGDYDGNVDVYVVPSTGGEPRRLTYHPGADVAIGWTPDGTSVLFMSHRDSTTIRTALHGSGRRRVSDGTPLGDGRRGFLFARRSPDRLCPDISVGA